jgi:hypothetical protein
MNFNELESTNRLLKVIVSLLLRRENENTPTLKQQVEVLNDLGVKPSDIAEILGKTGSYVNKELSGIRKKQKLGGTKNG